MEPMVSSKFSMVRGVESVRIGRFSSNWIGLETGFTSAPVFKPVPFHTSTSPSEATNWRIFSKVSLLRLSSASRGDSSSFLAGFSSSTGLISGSFSFISSRGSWGMNTSTSSSRTISLTSFTTGSLCFNASSTDTFSCRLPSLTWVGSTGVTTSVTASNALSVMASSSYWIIPSLLIPKPLVSPTENTGSSIPSTTTLSRSSWVGIVEGSCLISFTMKCCPLKQS